MEVFLRRYPDWAPFFQFSEFNQIQATCLPKIFQSHDNLIVSAPTSSGKTVIFELCIIKQRQLGKAKCLYLAPIKSLCHEKYHDWRIKFKDKLKVVQATGDYFESQDFMDKFDLMIATPEKTDIISRQQLRFLCDINLLLIDQIHMLNLEERGATLEAVVCRIMSINRSVRIVAVSATIPNIYEVGAWIKAPKDLICIFGEQHRPAKLHKVVLGFKGSSSSNPFTFQRLLNYKLLSVIRTYSQGRGALVFCPTQKGTQSACQQLLNTMTTREFIEDDRQLLSLVQQSKQVSNGLLQSMLPQGIAFHNAGLSCEDRAIVERLFLEMKIKVLCTTSTLSMGINLPARLVVIKSTQSYKGARGYVEYTQVELDQMMGRAGRPPFDLEGTAVIMTELSNCSRYNSSSRLEPLQSQLFGQLIEHVNAEISLRSLHSLEEILQYFFNSFCYIRMRESPATYGIASREAVDGFVRDACRKCVQTLAQYHIISYCPETGAIAPRSLSQVISRNAVEISTVIGLMQVNNELQSEKDYMLALCKSGELGRYRSKLDQRKVLKELNEKSKYVLKQAISTPERKCLVLMQALFNGLHIDNWELRKQAGQIMHFLKRVNYCVKSVAVDCKSFWLYFWSLHFVKRFQLGIWEHNPLGVMRQFLGSDYKQKLLQGRGIDCLDALLSNIDCLSTLSKRDAQFGQQVEKDILNLRSTTTLSLQNNNSSLKNQLLTISFKGEFSQRFKALAVCVGDSHGALYHTRIINEQHREIAIAFPLNEATYRIGIVKEGVIGFDSCYTLCGKFILQCDFIVSEILQRVPPKLRKSLETKRDQKLDIERKDQGLRGKSHCTTHNNKRAEQDQPQPLTARNDYTVKRSKQLKLPPQYRIPMPPQYSINQTEEETLRKKIRKDSVLVARITQETRKGNVDQRQHNWSRGKLHSADWTLQEYAKEEAHKEDYIERTDTDKAGRKLLLIQSDSKARPVEVSKRARQSIDAYEYFQKLFG